MRLPDCPRSCHRRRVRALVLVVAACGSRAAAPPPSAPPAPAPPPIAAAAPAPVTCGDAGVILRGAIDDVRDAGPDKEATIARACLHDAWPREVIDCVGSSRTPRDCLARLTPEQTTGYRKRMLAWFDEYPDEEVDLEDDEVLAEVDDFVDCQRGIGDVAQYDPIVTVTGKPRELVISLRRYHLLALCEHWPDDVRRCHADGKRPAVCRTLLDPDDEQDVVDRLAEVDAVRARVAAQKTPPTCERVVKTHYADARWKGALAQRKPAERARMIAQSRKLMLEACKRESWSEHVRACITATGGDACFHASNLAPWTYPPSALPIKTGIAECDAYGDTLRALARCTQIPRQAVQTMLDSYQRAAGAYATLPPAQRTATAAGCKRSDEAIRQSAQSLGCTI